MNHLNSIDILNFHKPYGKHNRALKNSKIKSTLIAWKLHAHTHSELTVSDNNHDMCKEQHTDSLSVHLLTMVPGTSSKS